MCVIVKVGNAECGTKLELRNALGIEPKQRKEAASQLFEDGDCLCSCDLEETARLASMKLSGEYWDMQTMTFKEAHKNR